MKKKYIKYIIGEEYKQWQKGNLILLEAGTGRGKTTFIKNELLSYCISTNQRMLYLTNRDALKEQIKNDIGDVHNVKVINYQAQEKSILDNIPIGEYDYIVMDEAHYFFSDSSFNRKTDLFFNEIINSHNVCKIMMTATAGELKYHISRKSIKIDYTYSLPTDYSYLKSVIAFNTYDSIDSIISDVPQDEQIVFFSSSATRALRTAQKHNGTFICSKYNPLYAKHVKGTENEEEYQRIIENAEFTNRLLCTTTALDNGINLKENSRVNNIIIDIFDYVEFFQCLGRKRIGEGEKVNLYFYNYKDNKRINGFKSKIVNSLARADYLMKYGEEDYTRQNFKNDNFVDSRIIDDVLDEDGNIHKVVNDCMYTKFSISLEWHNSILSQYDSITYKEMIGIHIGLQEHEIPEVETVIHRLSLEDALERATGKRLYADERKQLIEFIGLKDARGRLQKSFNIIQKYLEENTIYTIVNCEDKRRKLEDGSINPHRGKRYWQIVKRVIEDEISINLQ